MSGAGTRIGFFCDFDGTISENDMIAQIMRRFVPDEAAPLIERVNRRELSIRAGVEAMFALIPSSRFEEVRDFAVHTTRIRAGFDRFVDFAAARSWPITITSGGFDFFVEPAVAPWRDRLTVYCNTLDTTGPNLRVVWPHPCDDACSADCGLCKPTILRKYQGQFDDTIVIGDGVTDFEAARRADFVYARASLRKECEHHNLPHAPFETFDDIVSHLHQTRG
ncbi:MtnX-like HAD-IB family phosphatase [Alicyclobacillus cycloheptanicus]|uniref:2-hydroxy-3-keto-5-methylthiopentenyl-1-phosphate phosphatase n=1 Tax=Alicyclobacillus cycloheptanicus TaxID=1457 RepID=A0ABT9XJ97_9BACL|nr:MtnX-like HAD-IB family phosphatase [Alicyclobacillus cycloheptanicus]MDQ0189796.1 2-hydroxy-3-keto-5-methylthiopentenyl-1-phosphate phosphatase [Alicyclobacillus cycloheptanicus]WDM02512.1 MtnX-like HAD-IB family phosphatase [Alicyclobacillus cycloheptanicus]